MHKSFCILLLSCCIFLFPNKSSAQQQADPAKWTFSAQKIENDVFELHFKLQLDSGWHIWAIEAGGDGYQIVPSFIFQLNPKLSFKGPIKEKGVLITKQMEGIEGAVNYYSKTVSYTQLVKAPLGTNISGTLQYQICNEQLCLPPKDLPFNFILK